MLTAGPRIGCSKLSNNLPYIYSETGIKKITRQQNGPRPEGINKRSANDLDGTEIALNNKQNLQTNAHERSEN